ncbi:hypothetical protein RvY_17241 [Ramazzottius varieornatus]|uniref:Uncharacterized protein n=1 Tax=Ramazzottius varieornatus TaxID=947166 RepID=A0A1D1W7H3_RAMVA|nr:hypothetical protein RvY_17241 [Ramazzottius varieornatus]
MIKRFYGAEHGLSTTKKTNLERYASRILKDNFCAKQGGKLRLSTCSTLVRWEPPHCSLYHCSTKTRAKALGEYTNVFTIHFRSLKSFAFDRLPKQVVLHRPMSVFPSVFSHLAD